MAYVIGLDIGTTSTIGILIRLPDEVVAPYDTEPPPEDAVLVYEANKSK